MQHNNEHVYEEYIYISVATIRYPRATASLHISIPPIPRPQHSTRYTPPSTPTNTPVPYIWTYAGLMETTNPPVSVETAETTLPGVQFGGKFYSAASASLG